jgi:hypothetical protein
VSPRRGPRSTPSREGCVSEFRPPAAGCRRAGEGGADNVVAGVAVGLGDGRRGGGFAGAGAADDQGEVVTSGGGEDGAPLLLREMGPGGRGHAGRRRDRGGAGGGGELASGFVENADDRLCALHRIPSTSRLCLILSSYTRGFSAAC